LVRKARTHVLEVSSGPSKFSGNGGGVFLRSFLSTEQHHKHRSFLSRPPIHPGVSYIIGTTALLPSSSNLHPLTYISKPYHASCMLCRAEVPHDTVGNSKGPVTATMPFLPDFARKCSPKSVFVFKMHQITINVGNSLPLKGQYPIHAPFSKSTYSCRFDICRKPRTYHEAISFSPSFSFLLQPAPFTSLPGYKVFEIRSEQVQAS
jgi:hypothetical protein